MVNADLAPLRHITAERKSGGREGEREREVGREGEGGRGSGLTDLCFTT